MQNTVFQRSDFDSPGNRISPALYNLIIGLTLGWGFLVNWWMVKNTSIQMLAGVHPILLLLLYIGSCFTGVALFTKSNNPLISFIGYNFVVVPFGFIINLVVSAYDPDIVLEAIRVTGMVTVIMMILGATFPAFFQKIVGALTIALVCVIIVELLNIFIFHKDPEIIDWIVVLIFCGYIGYDWGRANNIPKTVDNAVDSAASLYIDIINLFLRILRILGRRR